MKKMIKILAGLSMIIIIISSTTNVVGVQYETSPYGFLAIFAYPQTGSEHQQELFDTLEVNSEIELFDGISLLMDEMDCRWDRIPVVVSSSVYIPLFYEGIINYHYENGINLLATIRQESMPVSMSRYVTQVRKFVELYDNDGYQDTSSPTEIKYWQINNEPDIDIYWSDSPLEFAELVATTYETIKSADPDAYVILGGECSNCSTDFYPILFHELATNPIYGGNQYFDAVDIHVYGNANKYTDIDLFVDRFRDNLENEGFYNVPMWITECGTWTGDPTYPDLGYQSEIEQARSLIKRLAIAFSKGVEKVFWAPGILELYNIIGQPNHVFDYMGLVYNGISDDGYDRGPWVKKIAFHSMKLFIQELGHEPQFVKRDTFANNSGYVIKFQNNGFNQYITWCDSTETTIQIVVDTPVVSVKNLVTDYDGSLVLDEIFTTPDGVLTIPVSSDPILVTEIKKPGLIYFDTPFQTFEPHVYRNPGKTSPVKILN